MPSPPLLLLVAAVEVLKNDTYIGLSLWILLIWDYGGLASRIFNRIVALPYRRYSDNIGQRSEPHILIFLVNEALDIQYDTRWNIFGCV